MKMRGVAEPNEPCKLGVCTLQGAEGYTTATEVIAAALGGLGQGRFLYLARLTFLRLSLSILRDKWMTLSNKSSVCSIIDQYLERIAKLNPRQGCRYSYWLQAGLCS